MFEGPDPCYWCAHGYAVINVDVRGAFSSEGDIAFWGRQDGRDGYDLIEWLGRQTWCNRKVGLTGNSWLAISQWFIAAEQPPNLAAIAPWEGWTDLYRCDVVRGGIPDIGFNEHMLELFAGGGRVEDVPGMVRRYPLMNSYWKDKIPSLSNIQVPAYVVGSWTNLIHGIGTLAGFRQISSASKWLRVHNSHEWTDYYRSVDDLRCFFDCFLKDIDNGWKSTPRVRLAVLDPGGRDVANRAEADFPLARTQYRSLHLNAENGKLQTQAAVKQSQVSYRSDHPKDKLSFTYRFPQDTELTGYFALRLWVEAPDAADMDIYVEVRKLSRFGRRGLSRNIVPPNPVIAWVLEQLYRLGKAKFGMMFFSGAAIWYTAVHTDASSIGNLPPAFVAIGQGQVAGVPISLLVAAAVAIVAHLILNRTVFGRWLYAVGTNARAAEISGVPVRRAVMWAFIISGLCAAVSSILYTGRLETGTPVLGQRILLDVVGAAVIGGVSLFGGKGKILWTLFGVLFLAVIDKSLQLLGLSLFSVFAIKGGVILLAAVIDALRHRLLVRR